MNISLFKRLNEMRFTITKTWIWIEKYLNTHCFASQEYPNIMNMCAFTQTSEILGFLAREINQKQ